MTYKLTEQVLHPQAIEKTNVKLADGAFHESTLNALEYYVAHGYAYFEGTALFIKIVKDWFNQVNVKSAEYGIRSKDERRNPIKRESVKDDTSYIVIFIEWLDRWKNEYEGNGLSRQTFETAIHTCKGIISLMHYLF